jgi:hypothetical protein
MASNMPRLVSPRAAETLEAVRAVTGSFDVDAYHVMDQRDDQLVADEILHGAASEAFIYHFRVQGTDVSGVSVIGARHLANHYRGLKHRIVGSVQKTGALHEYRAYPHGNFAGDTRTAVLHDLAGEPDYYAVVVEIEDIKTGNSIMVECREERFGTKSDGTGTFDRPNYQKIAQSKAYRNAVLALVPQDVVIRWKAEMLKLRKGEAITASVIDEKRANVTRFAARSSVAIDRRALEALTFEQISGLGDAAREGQLPAFVQAATVLGLIEAERPALTTETPPPRGRGRPPKREATSEQGKVADQTTVPNQPLSDEDEDDPPPPPTQTGRVQFDV